MLPTLSVQVKQQKFGIVRKSFYLQSCFFTDGSAVAGVQRFAVYIERAAYQLDPGVAAASHLVRYRFTVFKDRCIERNVLVNGHRSVIAAA